MSQLSHPEVITFFFSLAVLLAFARGCGELVKRLGQPAILGEILAGIVLGPTVFGSLAPHASAALFPTMGANALVLNSITLLALVLFLLVAGLEVDLSTVLIQGRKVAVIGILGSFVPFLTGFTLGWFAPDFIGAGSESHRLVLSLFLGTALSISALPVIARTLMDLNIFKTDLGMTVIAVAVLEDFMGWTIFAVILGLMRTGKTDLQTMTITIVQTMIFVGLLLTLGRWLINRILPWLQAYTSWPGGVLSFIISLGLFSAMLTEWLGIHAIFGAFMIGVAIGDSKHLRQHTRTTVEQFIGFIFAPLFFGSIGLKVNFITHFDPVLTLIVILVACVGKISASGFAAFAVGFPKKEAWSIGLSLNARGAMEIILGLLALQAGIIDERLFVALVVMALFTSLICGPILKKLLRLQKVKSFLDYLGNTSLITGIQATGKFEAIEILSRTASLQCRISAQEIAQAVSKREEVMSTALPNGVAIPHARIEGLGKPIVVVGLCQDGIDFDAPDGLRCVMIILVITPEQDSQKQLEILADVAKTFTDKTLAKQAALAKNITEFRGILNSRIIPRSEFSYERDNPLGKR